MYGEASCTLLTQLPPMLTSYLNTVWCLSRKVDIGTIYSTYTNFTTYICTHLLCVCITPCCFYHKCGFVLIQTLSRQLTVPLWKIPYHRFWPQPASASPGGPMPPLARYLDCCGHCGAGSDSDLSQIPQVLVPKVHCC